MPIWPIAALLVIAVATGVTLRVLDDVRTAEPVTAVQEAEGYWDSQVAHPAGREAVRPTMIDVIGVAAYEASAAAIREMPATVFLSVDHAPAAPPFDIEGFRDCFRCGGRR